MPLIDLKTKQSKKLLFSHSHIGIIGSCQYVINESFASVAGV
jgi:hypothetical protein